jgi:hypothetical protein
MFDTQRPIPWSARRYFINGIGEVTTASNELILPFEKNGELYIKLDWVFGSRDYLVAVLVLVSFELVKIPEYLLSEVIPLYRDNSKTNLAPNNLLYKFKSGKLEVEKYPGFYYIPFYVDYAINCNGDLINISSGKYKSWSITKPNLEKNQTGGYLYSRVINDLGFSKTLFQHRALCYVFKDYESNVETLVVNHMDGIPWNNALDNLELVTYQRNNIHAVEIGLRGDNKPILSKNLETGEILKFKSINACGSFYGQPRAGFVAHRLKYGSGKVYSDMLQFKLDDGSPWVEIDLNKSTVNRVGKSEDIQAKNVFTGDNIIFSGAPNGFALTGVKAATILSHVRDNKIIPVNGWNFRWFGSDIVWPKHSERHLKIYSKYPIYPPDGAIINNTKTGEETFFESVALACQFLKITKSTFHDYLKSQRILCDKYRLELYKLRETI